MTSFRKFLIVGAFTLLLPVVGYGVVPYLDDNHSPARPADDFEYADTTSGPLQNGWVIKAGTGTITVASVGTVLGDANVEKRYATFSTSQGLGFIVQYPPDTSEIKSKRRNFAFSIRATDSFAIEAKVQVRWSTDSTKYYWLRYKPGSGSNFQQGDTLVFPLGNGMDGKWHGVTRDFVSDIHAFLPSKSLDFLSRIYVRGNVFLNYATTFDRQAWVEGFSSQSSIAQGQTIYFYISAGDSLDTATTDIQILRFGSSTDLIATISGVSVVKRPIDSLMGGTFNGLNQNWPQSASWTVPQSAKSGVYMARFKLTTGNAGKYTYCPFVVKEDSGGAKSKILFKVSDNTWQAYNYWGGRTLNYIGYPGGENYVSYNRPYLEAYYYCGHNTKFYPNAYDTSCIARPPEAVLEDVLNPTPYDSLGAGQFFVFEFPLVKWLESHGYVLEYCDDIDLENWRNDFLHGANDTLEFYNLLVSSGHDEYWTLFARTDIQYRFRNLSDPKNSSYSSGPKAPTHNLAFLSGNNVFYRVVYDPTTRQIDNGALADTMQFAARLDTLNRGGITGLREPGYPAFGVAVVLKSGADTTWIMRGTGIQSGGSFGTGTSGGYPYGIAGYEVDSVNCDTNFYIPDSLCSSCSGCPSGLTVLARASTSPAGYKSNVAYYNWPLIGTRQNRSRIFAAGGVQWSWGLKDSDSLTNKITKNVIDGLGATVRGNVSQNTTWRGDVYLGGDVTVDSGVTLTLNSGTRIFVFPNNNVERVGTDTTTKTRLIVKGTLTAVGGWETDSIIFTSASTSPAAGDWGGISFTGNSRGNFDYCRVSYANTAISAQGDSVKVRDCTFNYFKSNAFYDSITTKLDLGKVVLLPCCCGLNNILMNTASSGAKAVRNASSGGIYAQGNWWDAAPPTSSWFVGSVSRTHYLSGPATPDSCGNTMSPPPKVAANLPTKFELSQNYPNPFNPTTTIQYALPKAANVELRIFNILGQEVRLLVDQEQAAGYYQVPWDGKDQKGLSVSTGIYLYQIKAGEFIQAKKMQLIK